MDQAVGIGAFVIAIVTALVTVYSAWLGRQALRQEASLRAKEHAQQKLDASFRMVIDMEKDYFQDPTLIYNRRGAASSLLKGEYSRELQNLMDFFSTIAEMVARGVVDKDVVYDSFYGRLTRYWTAAIPLIEQERNDLERPHLWNELESLYHVFLKMKAERDGSAVTEVIPSESVIKRFLEDEASLPRILSQID